MDTGLTAAPRPATLAGMTPPEPGALDVALKFAPLIAASGIWAFGIAMCIQNWNRAKADERRAEQAAADSKVTQGMLAALTEILRRTSPPSSQAGPAE